MRTLFKGGTVVNGAGMKRADLLIDGEKVVGLGRNLKAEADQTVDVSGCAIVTTSKAWSRLQAIMLLCFDRLVARLIM